jgi:hypothetical protein
MPPVRMLATEAFMLKDAYTAISTTGAPSQLIALIDLISDDQSQQAAGYRRLPPPRVL